MRSMYLTLWYAAVDSNIVLLDTRNTYESRIGRFVCDGVETITPDMRQFTDFPSFVERHVDGEYDP